MKPSVTVTNNLNGKEYEFPIYESSVGPHVVDIANFYKETGMFTYDEGFTSTASCKSDITYIDGDKGELFYRGYDISYLATEKSYLDTVYLLLHKKLPNADEYKAFDIELRKRSFVHESFRHMFQAFPDHAHPMAILAAGVSALATFYFGHLEADTHEEYRAMSHRIIAKIPTIAAFAYRQSKGLPYIYPDLERSFTENFLFMLHSYPYRNVALKPIEIKALDTIFTLHADHEQNASTTTVRTVTSTGAHPYAAIASGICALWGRAHGGANESVIAQLEMIGDVDKVDAYIKRAKDPNDSFRLMGFGHRVYKNFDPRATILKNIRDDLMKEIGVDNKLAAVADRIEQIALSDEYFISRKLYPNIDFYSGLILKALKIPKEMFAVIFVIGRTVGWMSQCVELRKQKTMKIARPRQWYVGPTEITPE